jgi:hypothetical protein
MTSADTNRELLIDELIDNVTSRRTAGVGAAEQDFSVHDLAVEEADGGLVIALAQLGSVEWPAEEAGEMIAARLAASKRPGRSPRWALAVGATVAATAASLVIVSAVNLAAGSRGTGPQRTGTDQPTSRTSSRTSAAHGPTPQTVAAMRIVSGPGALRAVGVIGSNNDYLFCPTRQICYIQGYLSPAHAEVARSLDGGATWTKGAALPVLPADEEWSAQISCPKPLICLSGYGSGLLVTRDGFAHASVIPVTSSGNQVGPVSCATVRDCVAVVMHRDGRKSLIYTGDGGRSWTAGGAPPVGVQINVGDVRCNPDAACIALLLAGNESDAKVAALRSTDGGRTWAISPRFASIGNQQEWRFDCGDGRDCLVTGNNGSFARIHVKRSGIISIQVRPYPKTWPPSGDDVSCATGRDCFIEVSENYANNMIEVTHDGGRTWAAAIRTPIAATYLSCPAKGGCIAVAPKNENELVVLSNLTTSR